MANSREGRIGGLRQIGRNLRSNNKVQVELGVSGLSLFLFPIGPTIIGSLNLVNAGLEVRDTLKKKDGATFLRSGLYAAAGLWELGLQVAGQKIGDIEYDFASRNFGSFLPDYSHFILGLLSSGAIGLLTGLVTNTTLWEMRRRNTSIPSET